MGNNKIQKVNWIERTATFTKPVGEKKYAKYTRVGYNGCHNSYPNGLHVLFLMWRRFPNALAVCPLDDIPHAFRCRNNVERRWNL